MTKEECIALLIRYAEYNGMGIPNLAGCREAMRTAAELLQRPSLPSNLDEAAEKIVIQLHPSMEYGTVLGDRLTMGELVELVKAGAKWKAGQFQKIEGELVDWYSSSEGKEYCCGIKTTDSFEVPEGFYIKKRNI